MHKALELRNVKKKIGGKTIIDNLSFCMNSGEIMGFLGPNGAGKTTSIRMMLGLAAITDGDIFINGSSITKDYKEAIANVGGLVENPDMYKHMTGYQNLLFFARISGKVNRSRIDEIVKFVNLEESIGKKVKTYSLGMKQRLGLAQAMYHEPSVLILDEPTNGLDASGIHELRDVLRALAEQKGVAVLISSHLLSEMELICDRVAIIDKGALLEVLNIRDSDERESASYILKVNKAERARTVILACNAELVVHIRGNSLVISVNDEEMQIILGQLIQNGVIVHEYFKQKDRLEDRYLHIIGGNQNG